jgi:hypothetical protein
MGLNWGRRGWKTNRLTYGAVLLSKYPSNEHKKLSKNIMIMTTNFRYWVATAEQKGSHGNESTRNMETVFSTRSVPGGYIVDTSRAEVSCKSVCEEKTGGDWCEMAASLEVNQLEQQCSCGIFPRQ